MNSTEIQSHSPVDEQLTIPFEMSPISAEAEAQAKRGWDVTVNGEQVADPISSVKLTQPKMNIEVNYSQRAEGYDGVVIREPGGAVTLPYMIDNDGGIYVGVVEEYRPTMGEEKTKNVPRGFSEFGESKEETAVRELHEETGYRALGSRLVKLAEGLNPNSTYFDYSRSKKEGVSIFAIPVKPEELEIGHDDEGDVFYTFPAHVRAEAEGDKPAERILGSRFIPITEALESRDMFTSSAAGHLMVDLLSKGEYLVPQN